MIPDLKSDLPSPARYERFAHILANRLQAAGVKVSIEARPDGMVSVVMPLEWCHAFVARLDVEVSTLRHELRRATLQFQREAAEMRAAMGDAERRWEQLRIAIHDRYGELSSGGLGKRSCIHKIKSERPDMTCTEIQAIIEGGDPRRKRARAERNARILRLKAAGVKVREIARREGIAIATVKGIVAEGRTSDAEQNRFG